MFRFVTLNSLVDPTHIPSSDIRPFGFNFVMSCPDELTLNVIVIVLENAPGKLLNLSIGEEGRVCPAHAIVNGLIIHDHILKVFIYWHAVWEESWRRSVKFSFLSPFIFGQVRFGAFNLMARILCKFVAFLESIEPVCAVVGGERPLSEPHIVLNIFGNTSLLLVQITSLCNIVFWWFIFWINEGLIVMAVQNDIFVIPVCEEIVPNSRIKSERIMEHEFSLWSVFLDLLSNFSVKGL